VSLLGTGTKYAECLGVVKIATPDILCILYQSDLLIRLNNFRQVSNFYGEMLEQLLAEIHSLAKKRFNKQSNLRIWYAKVAAKSWKVIVFDSRSHVVLLSGPIGRTARAAILGGIDTINAALKNSGTRKSS
jgi:hypothetical protein